METKEILVIVLIGVLLLAVGLQSLQLLGLTNAAAVTPSVSGAVVKSASAGSSAPTSLQNLPSMVGGC